jgi:hypothetical protein
MPEQDQQRLSLLRAMLREYDESEVETTMSPNETMGGVCFATSSSYSRKQSSILAILTFRAWISASNNLAPEPFRRMTISRKPCSIEHTI